VAKKYRNEDVRDLLGLSHETIRKYSLDFAEFLSEGANPPEGKHRTYSESDLRALGLIAIMKARNSSNEDIKATLKAGAEGELSSLLEGEPILNPVMERTIARQELANLQRIIEQAQADREAAEAEAQEWRDIAKEQKGRIAELEKQIEALKASTGDTIALHKQIERLTVLLEIEKEKGKKE
jgi:DNA-binding transcriptional MerR regulator